MSTETINPTELKSETLWKIAQDECGAFECDREGIEDYSGMHFRHLGDLLRFAQLVIDRNDAAYARKIAAKPQPCPFCRSTKIEADFGDESACYRCRSCGCQSGRVYFTSAEMESDDYSTSESEALAAWNRRA